MPDPREARVDLPWPPGKAPMKAAPSRPFPVIPRAPGRVGARGIRNLSVAARGGPTGSG
jgi:hypothetical protein